MKIERIYLLLFVIAIIMKLLHIAGADETLVLTLGSLAIGYFFCGFYLFSVGNIRTQNILISILAGGFLSIPLMGILFKLQYWEGAGILSLYGTMFSSVILMVVLIMLVTGASEKLKVYYRNMAIRSSILFVLSFTLLLTSFDTLLSIQYWDDPQLARLKAVYYRHPDNPEARRLHDDYISEHYKK